MASSPITFWQIDAEKMDTVTNFIFLGSKITTDDDCSHEIKRHLLLGRKAMTDLDSVLKSRDITLLTNVPIAKAVVFPVVMHGCESWTVKKAEHRRIDVFELWCWRRLLRVPWTARRSYQSSLLQFWMVALREKVLLVGLFLGFFVFSFQHSEYIIHSLLTYKASVENSAYVLWEFLCT